MNLFRKSTATVALVALVSGIFSTGVSANSTSEVEAANYLAQANIINNHTANPAGYNLGQNVLRQEIAAVARGVAGLDKKTTCDNVFSDVSSTTPNTWACYSVEALADAGLIALNAEFRPEANITKAEAVGMMVKAAFNDEYTFDSSKGTSWQEQVVAFAAMNGVTASFTNYDTPATRGFVFEAGAAALMAMEEDEDDILSNLLDGLLNGGSTDEDEDTTSTDNGNDVVTTPVVTGGNVEVTLNPATPVASTIPGFSTLVVAKFDVTAGSQDVSIDSILLKNTGLGSNDAVLRVALFTKDGRVSRDRNFSSTTDDVNVNLTSPLVVKAGSTVTIDAVVETGDSNNVQGSEFAISIHSINASANVLGNLPVVGKTMKIGSINAAQATISRDATLSNVNLGEREVNVASFQIRNNESSNDIKLSSITLRDSQNKMRSNLANLSLYFGNTKLSEVAYVSDRYVTFNFNEITLNSNQTARFTVKADIVGGAGDSVELFLDKKLDIIGKDTRYGFGLNVTNNYDGSSASNKSAVSILAGDLTIVGIDASTTDVQADKKDLMVGKFKIVSNAGKNLELEKITIELERVSGVNHLNTTIDTQRVRLVNENNGSSYELDLSATSTPSNLVFSDDLYVALGQETTFAVYVDTLLNAESGARFRVKLDTSDVNKFKIIETSDDEVVSNITPSTITLRNIEVKSTTAFVNRNTMLSSRNFVIGSTNNEVVSFEVEAGTMSDVNFDLVEVRGNITALSGTGNISNTTFTQAKLYHTSVSDANLVASRSASQFSNDIIRFDGFNSIVVAKDQTKKFIVTVDLADDENMDGVGAQFRLENINLRDSDNDDINVSSFVAANYTYQTTLNIQGSGDFKVNYLTTNSFNQYNKTVLAGNELTVASYELQGLNENVDVEEVIFTLAGATAAETKAALNNAKLYLNNTLVATAANSKINNNEILFDRLTSLIIPADENSELRLVLSTNTIGFNKLGEVLNAVFVDGVRFEKAEGVSSGKEITYNAAEHSIITDSRTFTVVPSTVLAAVQTTFNQSSTAQFELRVNAGQNAQTGSNSTPVVTVTQLDFTKSGNRIATDYVLKDEDGTTLATGVAVGNDVSFSGLTVNITDVEKLQIEAIVTSASDDTYGLTLRRNGITYTVNGEAGLINNSEQTVSFGSKN